MAEAPSLVAADGTPVWVEVCPRSLAQENFGLQFKIALKPGASDGESVVVRQGSIQAFGVPLGELTTKARFEAQKWLDENGIDALREALSA